MVKTWKPLRLLAFKPVGRAGLGCFGFTTPQLGHPLVFLPIRRNTYLLLNWLGRLTFLPPLPRECSLPVALAVLPSSPAAYAGMLKSRPNSF